MNNDLYYIRDPYCTFAAEVHRKSEVVAYKPTGKYRIYEDGHMEIEFKAIIAYRPWFKVRTKEVFTFVHEKRIYFKPGFTEYVCS